MPVEVGLPAPDFALKSQAGDVVHLSDYQGRSHVALVFYPFAFSGICTGELCEIRDNLNAFSDSRVQVIGISCDPMYSLKAFADAQGYEFPLLSDFWPHGQVSAEYGVFSADTGFAIRGTFLIDVEGVLRWSVVNGPGQARSLASYREAIASL